MAKAFTLRTQVFATLLTLMLCAAVHVRAAEPADSSGMPTTIICFGDPSLAPSSAITTSIPLQAGFYRASGAAVKIQPSSSGSECALAVSSGHAFATSAGMTALLVAADKDPSLVIVAASYRWSWGLAVPNNSPIKTIADLKGKRVGVQGLASASFLFGKAAVNQGGLNADTDVQWINVGFGATAANALQTDRVAAYSTYNGAIDVVGNLLGTPMRYLPSPVTLLQGNYGWLMRRSDVKNNPGMVAAVLRGAFQGIVYANANPAAGLKLHLKQYPEQDDPKTFNASAAILASRAGEQMQTDSSGLIGYVSPEQLQQTADFYFKNGLLANKVDVSKLVDLSAIKSANNFDKAKVVSAAK